MGPTHLTHPTYETLRGLRHLARAETARADADPLTAAIDDCPHQLQVGFEAARADVVRVAVLPPDHRTLAADFTSLYHNRSRVPQEKRPLYQPLRDDQTRGRRLRGGLGTLLCIGPAHD